MQWFGVLAKKLFGEKLNAFSDLIPALGADSLRNQTANYSFKKPHEPQSGAIILIRASARIFVPFLQNWDASNASHYTVAY